jgi:hypothetical protein
MLSLYQEFLEKTKPGSWIKLPSFKSNREHIQGLKLPFGLETTSGKAEPGRAQGHTQRSPAWDLTVPRLSGKKFTNCLPILSLETLPAV